MARTDVIYTNLSTWLSQQPANTVDTPYQIRVTQSATVTTLLWDYLPNVATALRNNPSKYVDISFDRAGGNSYSFVGVFKNCTSLVVAPDILSNFDNDYTEAFYGCTNLKSGCWLHRRSSSSSQTFNATRMYYNCSSLEQSYEVEYPTSLKETYFGCSSIRNYSGTIDSLTDMEGAFQGCTSLTSAELYVESSVANSITMKNTFYGCTSLTRVGGALTGVTNMENAFYECRSLTRIPTIPNTVTNMKCTFYLCSSLTSAPAIPPNVTDLDRTFYISGITSAPSIPSGVTSMNYTFYGCNFVTPPTIPNTVTNMSGTFRSCYNMTSAPEIPSSVQNMQYTFCNCQSMATVGNIPEGVTNLSHTFDRCSDIVTIPYVPSTVTNLVEAFSGCTKLKKISKFRVPLSVVGSSNAQNCFKDCSALEKVCLNDKITESDSWNVFKIELTYGNSTHYIEGKVYHSSGSDSITKTAYTLNAENAIKLPHYTDELWFPENNDPDVETNIQKMFSEKYGVYNKIVLPPDQKNFVMWADDPDNFQTNLPVVAPTVVDVVQQNNMNPVTSNAVYNETYSNYQKILQRMGIKTKNNYYGMTDPYLDDTIWIRTTTQGLLPYQSGGAGSGHGQLGTSSWYFKDIYSDKINGNNVQRTSIGGTSSETGAHWAYVTKANFNGSATKTPILGTLKLSNGLIINWGRFTPGATSGTVTFLTAFTSANTYCVALADGSASNTGSDTGGYNYVNGIEVKTASTIKLSIADSGRSVEFIAIGY